VPLRTIGEHVKRKIQNERRGKKSAIVVFVVEFLVFILFVFFFLLFVFLFIFHKIVLFLLSYRLTDTFIRRFPAAGTYSIFDGGATGLARRTST
jgi:hypothetical protein